MSIVCEVDGSCSEEINPDRNKKKRETAKQRHKQLCLASLDTLVHNAWNANTNLI